MKKFNRSLYILIILNAIFFILIGTQCFNNKAIAEVGPINTYNCFCTFQTSGPGTLYSVFDCGKCNKIQCYKYFDPGTCHKYPTQNTGNGNNN